MRVTLLGPQRRTSAARAAVAELMPAGPIATVNAGWQEREAEPGELEDVLGGRLCALDLFARWQRLLAEDPDYAQAEQELFGLLEELQALYALRLRHALAALTEIGRRSELPSAQAAALGDGLVQVRALDDWHLQAVAAARTAFYLGVGLGERASVVRERAQVAELVAGCRGFVITGGHVGVLLHVLHLFDARSLITTAEHSRVGGAPLIAWSAGAMACSDRVVLYNDFAAHGPIDPQLYAEGLGLFGGVLPFAHVRRRLRLGDRARGWMADRFAPRRCLLLSDGERVDVDEQGRLSAAARTLGDPGEPS